MSNFNDLSWEDGPYPINPNDVINTFPLLSRDTLLASGPEEFSGYFKFPQAKAFCKVISSGISNANQSGANEFYILDGTSAGFKSNQIITIMDEDEEAYYVLTIDNIQQSKITTKEYIPHSSRIFILEVYVQTRELYTRNPELVNTYDRGLFRYPYLPSSWSNINPFGLISSADRSDVKTFSSNISINWQIVTQDTVIEESFEQMDYEFLNELYILYSKQNIIGYRPRDLNLNLYLVEMLPLEIGKMHRYWVNEVKIKYKIHNILNDFGYVPELRSIR